MNDPSAEIDQKMNVKMIVTRLLAIILFVSGVYCSSTEEDVEEFPSRYPLQSCKSNSEYLRLDSPDSTDSTFEISRSDRNPRRYYLIQTFSNHLSPRKYSFRKLNVHFVSMRDAELTMIIYPFPDQNITWNLTCIYPSITLARKFYKDMTQVPPEQPPELTMLLTVDSLKKPNDVALEYAVNLFADSFENYTTLVVKNDDDDPILIFPTDAVEEIIQSADTEISLYIKMNPDERVQLYKFGFIGELMTWLLRELLHKLCRHIIIDEASARRLRQWRNNTMYRGLFNLIENSVQRQKNRNDEQISELTRASNH